MVLSQTVRRWKEPQTASIPDMGGVQTCPATLPCFWLSEAIVTPPWACLPAFLRSTPAKTSGLGASMEEEEAAPTGCPAATVVGEGQLSVC